MGLKVNMQSLCCLMISLLVMMNGDWVEASFKERDKVLYKDLGTLHFYQGQHTTARRTRPVPQLVCLKGCNYPQPSVVQCSNAGWDGTSNLWKCKAQLEQPYALDQVEVVCEGYNRPDDPFVTVGSCSLEFSIKRKGKSVPGAVDEPPVKAIPFVLCVAVLIFLMYKICLKPEDDGADTRPNGSGGGSGPDDGHGPGPGSGPGRGPQMGWNIPGMNQRHRHAPNAPGYGFAPGSGSCGDQGTADGANGSGGSGSGFWTGLAAGGVLGYLAGGNRNRNTAQSSSFFGGGSTGGMFSSGETESSYFGRGSSSEGTSGLFGSNEDEPSTSESVATARYRQR